MVMDRILTFSLAKLIISCFGESALSRAPPEGSFRFRV